jgi:hypothetical protein
MVTRSAKKPTVWQSLAKIILGILVTILTSQLASTNPVIDNALKVSLIEVSHIAIDALTASGSDSLKKDTVQVPNTINGSENN